MTSKEAITIARARTGLPVNKECAIITDDELKIIEKDLKTLKKIEKQVNKAGFTLDDFVKSLLNESIDNKNKIKAFEIIKKKELCILFNAYPTWESYQNRHCAFSREPLTKEEFNLLKEVLKNE